MKPAMLATLTAALFVCACATTPPAAQDLAAARSSVDAARASGAPEFAAAEFNDARNKLERAQALSLTGDGQRAINLAQEADVDAQLARARAQAAHSQRAAQEVGASDETLREELGRQAPPPPSGAVAPGASTLP